MLNYQRQDNAGIIVLVMPLAFILVVSLKMLIEVLFALNDVDFLLMILFSC